MSLTIRRAGLFDTVQDGGRTGCAHLGINPGGVMDSFSARQANALLGKDLGAPVMELHFPAAVFVFDKPAIIAITGADLGPLVNDRPVPLYQPLALAAGSMLRFQRPVSGTRCYLAQTAGWELSPWLNSCSTHLLAGAGGWEGRRLQAGDVIPYNEHPAVEKLLRNSSVHALPWSTHEKVDDRSCIQFLIGSEWHHLSREAQAGLDGGWFEVGAADRMGYALKGKPVGLECPVELLSSPVSFGTVQLLPSGQLLVLMADRGTTGGYPRVAQVIGAHLPLLSQKHTGNALKLERTDLATAEQKWMAQHRYLHELQLACRYRLEEQGLLF